MNIIQLRYLVDVGELGSFTEAAKKNRMTVPAISISISQLEEELEVALFERSRKGVTPTAEGKKVIQHAISILSSIDKMKKEIMTSKHRSHGNILISTIPGFVSKVINTMLEFQKNYPFMNVQMFEGETNSVLNQVKNGTADMGFVSFKVNQQDPELHWQPIIRDHAILVVNKSSALRFNQNLSGNEIKDEIIVLYNDPYIKMMAEKFLLSQESNRNRLVLVTNNVDGLFQMVTKGNAITIATEYTVNSLPSYIKDELVTISISEFTTIPNYLWRVTRKDQDVSEMIEQFTKHLLSQLT